MSVRESIASEFAYHYMRGEQMIFRYDNAADTTARDISHIPASQNTRE